MYEVVVAIASGLLIFILYRLILRCMKIGSGMVNAPMPDIYPPDFNKDIIPSKKSVYIGPQGIMRGLPVKRKRLAAEYPLLGLNGRPRDIMYTTNSADSALVEGYSARYPPSDQKIDIYSGDYDEDYIESPQMLGYGTGPAGVLRAGTIKRQPYFYGTGLGQVQVAAGGEHRSWPYTLDKNCSSQNILV
jgi:hypothetical protein